MKTHTQLKGDGSAPVWTWRVVLQAVGLTLLLFTLLPLGNVLNQPDIDSLIPLRSVDIALRPPPMVLPDPEPIPAHEPDPDHIEWTIPIRPALPPPSAPPPTFSSALSLHGTPGLTLNAEAWIFDPGIFSLSEIDTPPRPTVQLPPHYPHSARQAGIEGQVEVEFTVTVDGRVVDVRILDARPPDLFNSAARAAVERWRFEPALRRGEAVPARVRIPLQFKLDR